MLSSRAKAVILAHEKGYVVNSVGKVVSPSTGKFRKLDTSNRGYYRFNIRGPGRSSHSVMVHRLAAYQKYGDKLFKEGILVRHKDNNSLNNSPINILIGTQSDNMMDRPSEVRKAHAIKAASHRRKFSDDELSTIRKLRSEGATYKDLMVQFNITSKGSLHYMLNHNYVTKA